MNRNKINENVQEENEEENKKGGLLFLKRMRIALGSLAAVVALSAGGYKLVKDYNDNTPKNSIESQTEDNTDDTSLPFDYNTDDLDDKDNINNNSKEDTKDNKNDSKTTISDSNEDDNTNSAKMNNEEHNVNNDSSNSNNNKNNNDENNSNDNKPNKSHHHHYELESIEYSSNGSNKVHTKTEIWVCPEDGAKKVKVKSEKHSLGEATNTEYKNVDKNNHEVIKTHTCEVCEDKNIKIITVEGHTFELSEEARVEIPGNDEVHQLKKVYKCAHDEATKTKTTTEKHTYGEVKDNGDGTTSKECEECNHTAVHEHDFQLNRSEYEKVDDNTHKRTDIYVCPEDGAEDIKETIENHTKGELQSSETKKISAALHETTEVHKCGSGECEGIVETAKTAGHTYEHKDYIETPEDASYCEKEELECSGCNDVIIRGHIEHQWTDLSNGDKACTNCGTLLSETDQPSQSSEVIALNDKQISMDFISKCLEEFLYSVYEEETNEKRVATNKKNKQKVLTLG